MFTRLVFVWCICSASCLAFAADASAQDSDNLTGDWFGARQKLADKGITFDISFTGDVTKNVLGGLDTAGSTWRQMIDVAVTLDTKPLFKLEGGTVYADFQNATGPNPSDTLVGDIQGIDGLDGVPGTSHQNRTQLSQLWYQQTAFDGSLRIKVGKVDANTEFDHSDLAQEFIHQSAGSSATLFTLPTYPDPAAGFNLFLKPRDDLQFGVGIYDGSLANGVRTGELGPLTTFHGLDDLFLISEVDKSWKLGPNQLAGRLGVGGWYSTNQFTRLDGRQATGTGGPYALIDQALWRTNPKDDHDARGIGLFLMYGYGDPAILPVDHNLGAGLSWTGPIAERPNDITGVEMQSIHFGNAFHAHDEYETSFETFYKVQLKPWFSIKPDLQYIANPGGQGTRDALAFTMRIEVDF